MKAENLTSVDVEHDNSTYGVSVADELSTDARKAGLTVTSSAGGSGATAVFYAGLPGAAASHALDAASGSGAGVKLFAPSALYDDAFVKSLSAAAQQALTVSSPGVPSGSLDSVGQSFVSTFAQHYGHQPAPQAIFGYEAMRAVIATLKQAGVHADQRTTVVTDFRDLTASAADSALGAYSLHSGDTTLGSFVFARVSGGSLVVSAKGAPKAG
jgi:ABC-type branched-subunit amino acid transport system substrate-binding protein